MITRRSALVGLGALFCAPAIVRASSLMPVRALKLEPAVIFDPFQRGRIIAINILSGGSGYTVAPVITFAGVPGIPTEWKVVTA